MNIFVCIKQVPSTNKVQVDESLVDILTAKILERLK